MVSSARGGLDKVSLALLLTIGSRRAVLFEIAHRLLKW